MCKITYARHRFPPEIIQYAVWLYFRFPLSYRDVEDLLSERGIDVSYETVRRWALKFGRAYAYRLRRSRLRSDPRWHLDEVFVTIKDLGLSNRHDFGGRKNNRAENSHLPVRQRFFEFQAVSFYDSFCPLPNSLLLGQRAGSYLPTLISPDRASRS
jgi:transposase-like protein